MADRINGLNWLINGSNANDDGLMRGNVALESEDFTQAWENYSGVYGSNSASKEQKVKAALGMYNTMCSCDNDDELVRSLWRNSVLRNRDFHGRNVRAWHGRDWLLKAAQYGDPSALCRYGLIWVGLGGDESFAYRGKKQKDYNGAIALQWAESRMLISDNPMVRKTGHIICAEYYLTKCKEDGYSQENIDLFCKHTLNAKEYDAEGNDEYVCFYLAHIYADNHLKDFSGGKYADYNRGKAIFEGLSCNATDSKIKEESKKMLFEIRQSRR